MNREIKFKVRFRGKPFGIERLNKGNWEWMCFELNPDKGERWTPGVFNDNGQGLIRRQYAGIDDISGEDIYEGDILEIPETYETGEMSSPRYKTWKVVFKFGMFTLENNKHPAECDSTSLFNEYNSYDGKFEIIGNVYENPELL